MLGQGREAAIARLHHGRGEEGPAPDRGGARVSGFRGNHRQDVVDEIAACLDPARDLDRRHALRLGLPVEAGASDSEADNSWISLRV